MTDSIFSYPTVAAMIAAILLLGIIGKLLKFSFERIAKWYLYLSVFASIIVMDSIFFPFIGGKDYFFRFSVELALISFILWWAFEARAGEAKKRLVETYKKPIVIAVTVFVGMVLLACLFAYDAHAAFWSNYERGEGGFQMLHYYIFFILLSVLFTEEKEWKNIFKFSLAAAGGMILYGIAGNYSLPGFIGPYAGATPPTGWFQELISGRFQGSLGNPAYVAPYLIFSMFYAAYLWLEAKLKGTLTALAAWGYGILIAIFLFFFILSQTRGAFLGLAAGIFVMLLYWIFSGKANKNLRKWSAIALVILALIGVGLYAVRNTSFVQNLPEGRLLQISTSDSTAQTRFWVWDEAWQGFLERPIFGWGPENFTTVFDKFFNPKFYIPGQNAETWFDRAHSIYFDYLVETGILGLLSYLAIFFVFYWEFFKKKVSHHLEGAGAHALEFQKGLLIALPVAYLVQGVAIFDVFPMYINLFLFFGFATYYFTSKKS